MKKVLATVLTMMVSQIAFAGDIYCGSNIESVPGSQVFNKSIFWEKADTTKNTVRFLLQDKTVVRAEDLTPETLAKVTDGSLVLGYSFSQGRAQLFIGVVKRDAQNKLSYTNLAVASGSPTGSAFLMANNATLMCVEQ